MRKEISLQTPSGDLGSAHPYNEPGLSPIQFLYAVMYCPRLPMVTRIAAAKALLPFTEPRPVSIPTPQCTIVIPPLPNDHGSVAQDPASGSTGIDSENPDPASKTTAHSGRAGELQNLETTS